ncbi:MAG: DNA photolyase family protein [Flavobacteriaceae bacterium]|jgi:deoxyribodipyrimidine photo-lyase|nr:DNA photolyase family protein [Flavobacteriaceae bacterium]
MENTGSNFEKEGIVVFWFRRDLRLEDNVGLYKALQQGRRVLLLFIFDKLILEQFNERKDQRVDYIYQTIKGLNKELFKSNTAIKVMNGYVNDCIEDIISTYKVEAIYCNEDYEPKAIKRDKEVQDLVERKNIAFYSFKDQVIFNGKEIVKKDNTPYQIYTPYSKVWRSKLLDIDLEKYNTVYDFSKCIPLKEELPTLQSLGFDKSTLQLNPPLLSSLDLSQYKENREYPAVSGTSRIGIALRFGTLSIRECVKYALESNDTWLSQLIWRDFFMQILYHFPHVEHGSFKTNYDNIVWRNDEREFELWCKGQTGYPLVDAGMRELNTTGYMHNRVRMVVASFLCKHLLIDWRWGEAYFAQYLIDYDLAANNGNWQWAAGCGCDAAPYFRVFNPTAQQEKFDKDFEYIQKWVPEYRSTTYPKPIVDHKEARERAIERYKMGINR